MRLALHQPEYLPCLALCAKAARSDVLVWLDDVQFTRDALQQRARIDGPDGYRWLTIPYVHAGRPQLIKDVRVARPWRERHEASIAQVYAHFPGYQSAVHALESTLSTVEHEVSVSAISRATADLLFGLLGITTSTLLSSQDVMVDTSQRRSSRVLAICQALGADTYVTGRGGMSYLDMDAFSAAGVAVELSTVGPRAHRPGLPSDAHVKGISALDPWLWLGHDVADWFRQEVL